MPAKSMALRVKICSPGRKASRRLEGRENKTLGPACLECAYPVYDGRGEECLATRLWQRCSRASLVGLSSLGACLAPRTSLPETRTPAPPCSLLAQEDTSGTRGNSKAARPGCWSCWSCWCWCFPCRRNASSRFLQAKVNFKLTGQRPCGAGRLCCGSLKR